MQKKKITIGIMAISILVLLEFMYVFSGGIIYTKTLDNNSKQIVLHKKH